MDSYDSEKRRILQGFSKSTKFAFLCTAQTSKFQRKSVKLFARMKNEISFFSNFFIAFFSGEFCHFSAKFRWIFLRISQTISENENRQQASREAGWVAPLPMPAAALFLSDADGHWPLHSVLRSARTFGLSAPHFALGELLEIVLFGQAGRYRVRQAHVHPLDCAMKSQLLVFSSLLNVHWQAEFWRFSPDCSSTTCAGKKRRKRKRKKNSQKMMTCLEILIKSARKTRKKAEHSGIGAKFHSFISFFQSHP